VKKPAKPKKRGPKEERLAIQSNWKEGVKRSIQKKKPPDGWPKANIEKL
jgi:hypothetical protein